jgi:hypothetical protein
MGLVRLRHFSAFSLGHFLLAFQSKFYLIASLVDPMPNAQHLNARILNRLAPAVSIFALRP